MYLPILTLGSTFLLAITTAALPILKPKIDSYGRYHDYGHYGAPYGHYPDPPLEAELAKLDARGEKLVRRAVVIEEDGQRGWDTFQECGFEVGKGCIDGHAERQVMVSTPR